MATTKTKLSSILCASLLSLAVSFACTPAFATKLPPELAEWFKEQLPAAKIKIDGTLEFSKEAIFLPLEPNVPPVKKGKLELRDKFPSEGVPDLLTFSNGWGFVRLIEEDSIKTISNFTNLPEAASRRLMNEHLPSDLIVPENFFVPIRLKALAKDIAAPILEEHVKHEKETAKPAKNTHSAVFVTSPLSGKITMLDDVTLEKISDFQTDGTPGSMAAADNKLYVTDQAKSRILILDPMKGQFLGQIDLPKKTSPKGIAALPNGKLLYISEYSSSNVDIIEVKVNKVLLRTKVVSGPSQVAITPDGNSVLVLNVPAGKVTILSTLNQKVTGMVQVGTLPNGIAITPDSKTAFITNRHSNSVSVIDLVMKKVTKTIETGTSPTGVVIDSAGQKLYVANAKDNTISIFDVQKRTKIEDVKLPLDIDFPGALLKLPDKRHLVVTSASTPNVGLFNMETNKFETQPTVGHPTDQILWMNYP
jgi:YVTN family beta-propeller protein